MQFTFDNTNYAQQLQGSWQQPGAWSGRTLLTPVGPTFPEVDCVILPAPKEADDTLEQVELYQVTVSNEKKIERQTLANILCALPDAKRYTLYFVVPKEHFRTFTVETISRGCQQGAGKAGPCGDTCDSQCTRCGCAAQLQEQQGQQRQQQQQQ